jgi:hypothetical protein
VRQQLWPQKWPFFALVATAGRLDAPADPSVMRPGWSTWRADGVVIDVTASEPSTM